MILSYVIFYTVFLVKYRKTETHITDINNN